MQIQLTNQTAIALHALLDSLYLLDARQIPDSVKLEIISSLLRDEVLLHFRSDLEIKLNEVRRLQEEKMGVL